MDDLKSTEPWWYDAANIRVFCAHLIHDGRLETIDEVLYFLNKPWKWTEEFRSSGDINHG